MGKKASIGNGQLKNAQNRSKFRKQRQVDEAKANARLTRKLVILGVLFALLGFLVAIVYQYYFTTEEMTSMSSILRNHAKSARQTIEQKFKFDAYVMDDPLADIIKTKLRPVQERIASLKTQCNQYERMEQIPGGPTKFIQSSLHELNTDIEQKVFALNMEALSLLMDYVQRGNEMVKAGIEMVSTGALRINSHNINMLTMEGVYFIPIGDIPQEVLDEARKHVTLEKLINMVEELANMYESLEEAGHKLGQLGEERGIKNLHMISENMSDEEYELIMPYVNEITEKRERIDEFKEKNNKYLQLFQELSSNQVQALTSAMAQVRENDEKRRRPYLTLHMAVMKDIKNLKIRIDNLKYAYAKRKTTN